MIAFRDEMAERFDLDLVVYTNPRGQEEGIGPFSHGSAYHTDVMKTEALRQALDAGKYDAAFAAHAATRKPPVPRSASIPSARRTISGIRATSARNSGTFITVTSVVAKAYAPSRCPTGPKSTSGATSRQKTFRCRHFTTPRTASSWSATAC